MGQDFSALFKRQIDDKRVSDLLDLINARFPDRGHLLRHRQGAGHPPSHAADRRVYLYVVLLRHLDYAEEFDIAELEIELEAEGKLDEFIKTMQETPQAGLEHDPQGCPADFQGQCGPARSLTRRPTPRRIRGHNPQRNRERRSRVSKVVERCFELAARRRPGKALVWVIDEVGQHVARSGDKIEDLRAIVQEFGQVGRNLVKARKLSRPVPG